MSHCFISRWNVVFVFISFSYAKSSVLGSGMHPAGPAPSRPSTQQAPQLSFLGRILEYHGLEYHGLEYHAHEYHG